jgi:hypothetical protein
MTCGPHKPLLSYLVGMSQTPQTIYSDNQLQTHELDKLKNQNEQKNNKQQQLYKPIEQTIYNSLTNQNKNNNSIEDKLEKEKNKLYLTQNIKDILKDQYKVKNQYETKDQYQTQEKEKQITPYQTQSSLESQLDQYKQIQDLFQSQLYQPAQINPQLPSQSLYKQNKQDNPKTPKLTFQTYALFTYEDAKDLPKPSKLEKSKNKLLNKINEELASLTHQEHEMLTH